MKFFKINAVLLSKSAERPYGKKWVRYNGER